MESDWEQSRNDGKGNFEFVTGLHWRLRMTTTTFLFKSESMTTRPPIRSVPRANFQAASRTGASNPSLVCQGMGAFLEI